MKRTSYAGIVIMFLGSIVPAALARGSVTCLGHPATFVGTPGADGVTGTPNRDVIVTFGGPDRISDIGKDHDVRTGNDLVCSGPGDDTVVGVSGRVQVGRGHDDVRTDGGVLRGGPGKDSLFVGYGLASGGAGNDRVVSSYGMVEGGAGDDHLMGGEEIDGGAGADRMTASPDCGPRFVAGPGNDVMVGGRGACAYDEAFSSDLYLIPAPRGIRLNLGKGQARGWGRDRISNVHIVIGSPHDDVIVGSSRRDSVEGAGGQDRIVGGGGSDSLIGDDYYSPEQTAHLGLAGSDVIRGGRGNDDLFGAEGADRLYAGAGDDRVAGAEGSDTLFGGTGTDLVDYNRYVGEVTSGVSVDLRTGRGSGALGKDSLSGFESIHGSSFDDVLLGDVGQNTFQPGFGEDAVRGGPGDDVMIDSIPNYWPSSGDDTYRGGRGADTVSWVDADEAITADLATGTASGNGNDILNAIEILVGSINDDRLLGDRGENQLLGSYGDDYLDGREGSDALQGGGGADLCFNGEDMSGCP